LRIHKCNKEPRLKTGTTSEEGEDTQQDIQEGSQAGDHKANGWDFHQTSRNKGLEIVEGLALFEMEKETAHKVRAGVVGAPATLGSFPPPVRKIG
jgi:hypothetical protein